jgi:hypothetical protein
LWGFKTEVLETTPSNHVGQVLHIGHGPLQGKNFEQNKATYQYIRVNNEENIKYLNYLLSGEDWGMFIKNMTLLWHIKNFYKPSLIIFYIAITLRKVNTNKQTKINGSHLEFVNLVKN